MMANSRKTHAVVLLEVRQVVLLVLSERRHDLGLRNGVHDAFGLGAEVVERFDNFLLALSELCNERRDFEFPSASLLFVRSP